MEIRLNGEPHQLSGPVTLRQLLEGLDLPSLERGVAVAVNGELIRKAEWEGRDVQPSDEVEVVSAAQGG